MGYVKFRMPVRNSKVKLRVQTQHPKESLILKRTSRGVMSLQTVLKTVWCFFPLVVDISINNQNLKTYINFLKSSLTKSPEHYTIQKKNISVWNQGKKISSFCKSYQQCNSPFLPRVWNKRRQGIDQDKTKPKFQLYLL